MLIHNIGSLARKLQDEFQTVSSLLTHQGVKGDFREKALKNTLRELLPVKYSIASGIIVDANKSQSKQQDFIIYDGFSSPAFLKKETLVVLPIESVYATTEIKSTLTKRGLEEAVNNVISVKSLSKSLFKPPYLFNVPSNFIYSSVFAYTCDVEIGTLKTRFDEMNQNIPFEHRLSTICILDQGCIVNVHKDNIYLVNTQPSENTFTIVRRLNTELALYMYYLMLQFHLSSNVVYPPNLLQYANYDKPFEQSPISFNMIETLKEVGQIKIDNFIVYHDDYERYLRIKPFLGKNILDSDVSSVGLSEELIKEIEWGRDWFLRLEDACARSLAKEAENK